MKTTKHYTSLENCLSGLLDLFVKKSAPQDAHELRDAIKQARQEIKSVLKPLMEIKLEKMAV